MSRGPNAGLIGARDAQARLATPCLLLDADAFEHNLAAMMDLARRYRRQVRPHVKAHKCTTIGRRQLEAGAVGLCCATVREAEVMAEAGLEGILVTSPVTAPAMIERLAHAHARAGDLAVVIDSAAGVEALAGGIERRATARRAGRDRRRPGPDRRDPPRRRRAPRAPDRRAAAAPLPRRPGLLRPSPARAGLCRPQGEGRRAVGPSAAVPRRSERRRGCRPRSSPAAAPARICSTSRRGRSPRFSRARICSWTSSTARSSWRPAAPRRSGLRSRSPRG